MPDQVFIPVNQYLHGLWPSSVVELPEIDALDHVWMEPLNVETTPDVVVTTGLLFEGSVEVGVPGLDALSLVLAPSGTATAFMLRFAADPTPAISLIDVPIALRCRRDLLKPARQGQPDADGMAAWELDPTVPFLDLTLAKVTITVDFDGNLTIDTDLALELPPAMIGDSGVVVEAHDVGIFLDASSPPPGKPPGWKGVHIASAALHLPAGLSSTVGTLSVTDADIGNGGFSGGVAVDFAPPKAVTLLGMDVTLQHAGVTFVQNALTASELRGTLRLPFFDEPVEIAIAIGLDGHLAIELRGGAGGLVSLTKPGVLELQLDSLGFEVDGDRFLARMSGGLRPLVGGLDWPRVQVRDLTIDADGNVDLPGGWLDLRESYTLDLHGFQFELTKLGLGSPDDGGRWVGFSGGLKLVEGMSAGASVEGLRVTWYDDGRPPALTLNGVGVEMQIPGVLRFKGSVSYRDLPGGVHRFDGDIRLVLSTLDLELDGQLVVGFDDASQSTFFAIYLGVELPAGIPLWTTGLGLYGLAGLVALNMEPDKAPAEPWYGIGPGEGWYKKPQIGVTDLRKWRNEVGSTALGAGVTIGTVADNGFTVSGRLLLAIVFPGPIVMLEGKANILAERSSLSDDPLLRALAVIDGRAGTFQVGLDAHYEFAVSGEVIDLGASADALFDFDDPMAWHLYLGMRDPRERRIRAEIFFHIFEASAYLMLDARQLATGAFVGYHRSWDFGPIHAGLEAWIEGHALVSFKPVHFHGELWLHGSASLSVFGFGFDIGADARVGADVFDPFAIKIELSAHLGLPWPLPDFDVDLTLEWGPEKTPPPLPLPLKEVAVEHFKVTASWPLPRRSAPALLAPSYDPDGDGFLGAPFPPLAAASAAPPPANAPVVPLDARPHVTFARTVHDDALIGVNAQPPLPHAQPDPGWEWIGDPAKNEGPVRMRTGLREMALQRWAPASATWVTVARKGPGANPPGVPALFGSWAPVPQLPGGATTGGSPAPPGNTKLWLWSRSGFDYTRHSTGRWPTWWASMYPNYPCVERPPDEELCCGFGGLVPGTTVTSPWICPEHPELALGWAFPTVARVGGDEREPLLCFDRDDVVELRLGRAVKQVRLFVDAERGKERQRTCADFRDRRERRLENPYVDGSFSFVVFDSDGRSRSLARIWQLTTPDGQIMGGLDVGYRLRIALATPADEILVLLSGNSWTEVITRDAAGDVVAEYALDIGSAPQGLEFTGDTLITEVEIVAHANETVLHRICATTYHRGVRVVGIDRSGAEGEVVPVEGGEATLRGDGLVAVRVEGRGTAFCLRGFCVTVGISRSDGVILDQLSQHLTEETARWSQTGFVLEPHTAYRLAVTTTLETRDFPHDPAFNTARVQTELAYFRTMGPPGVAALSVPVAAPAPAEFASGLDDLTRYVRQTIPPTVPPPGQLPRLPRPVFRAYDVGVAFDEDYVDLLYRAAGRDLGLYLYDNNNEPARDAFGRLLVASNRWGRAETLQLTETDKTWIETINASTCARIDEDLIVRTRTLAAGGQVLGGDTLYEARLVPLLLHETFDRYALGQSAVGPAGTLPGPDGGWVVEDAGGAEGPSVWTVGEDGTPVTRHIVQKSNIWGGPDVATDPTNPGTILLRAPDPALPPGHPDQPANWTDYRLTAILRSGDDDALGLAVRRRGPGDFYVFAMDRQRAYRRLVRVAGGVWTTLAQDRVAYAPDSDMVVSIEAFGDRLRVYQDGALVFDVRDGAHPVGGIGLYAWANQGARFADVRVDDFRAAAPVVYRFAFTTSRFADVYHQMQSGTGETFTAEVVGAVEVAAAVLLAGAPATVGDAEARAYAALAERSVGAAARADTARVEATAIRQGADTVALLIRTAEPVDWTRTSLEARAAAPVDGAPATAPMPEAVPAGGAVVIADWSAAPAGLGAPIRESLTVLLREQADPDGLRLEYRTLPTTEPPAEPDGTVLHASTFTAIAQAATTDGAPLLTPAFADLSGFTVQDPADGAAPPTPSAWAATAGVVTQIAVVGAVTAGSDAAFALPGTLLSGGDAAWRDVAIAVRLRTDVPAGAVGVHFRMAGPGDFYRFSADPGGPGGPYRRLVKCTGGVFSVLWEDTGPFASGVDHDVRVEARGGDLRVVLDGAQLCSVHDTDHLSGGVALYAWRCKGAAFSGLVVTARTTTLPGWEILDAGPLARASAWLSEGGALTQTADITGGAAGVDPATRGSWAVSDDPVRDDVRVRVRVALGAPGALGVAVRWQGPDDHVALVLDAAAGTRRVVRRVGGTLTTLWSDTAPIAVDAWRDVVVEAIGTRLRVMLDGLLLADVHDATFRDGRVALLACGGGTEQFARFSIERAVPKWMPWGTVTGVGTLAAGRRVRVFAGAAGDLAQPAVTGETRTFLGFAAGDPAGVRLPAEGVDVRLVASDATVLHARRFAPDAAFAPEALRVLRAADGTGMILVPPDAAGPAGTRLPCGIHRLSWTFRRDNTAADPSSLVLREHGDSSTESGRVDVVVP
jgi:hypothetical protein